VTVRPTKTGTHLFIEQIAVLLEADGLPRVAGRMFGYLLMSAEPCSLDEIARFLRLSKASISINARLLETRGVLQRVGRESDRRDYYRISDDCIERSLEQRIARWRRFRDVIAGGRETCVIKHAAVRNRLEAMDQVYSRMLDATTRALDDWRGRNRKRATSAGPAASHAKFR
jgi:DNA-binding transcriptional regulator GbsR (MarR family)